MFKENLVGVVVTVALFGVMLGACGALEISYTVKTPGAVSLGIYDGKGRLVRTLQSGKKIKEPGAYKLEWDGKDDLGNPLPSGPYTYQGLSANVGWEYQLMMGNAISGTAIGLGAQNMHWEKSGAFTGEVSATMLRELYCHYVIIGHSERRTLFGETDDAVNRKVKTALASNLRPIVCVGETLQQRQAGQTEAVIRTQVLNGLKDIGADQFDPVIMAYEPVWAIGTGMTATPAQAQDVHAFIRGLLQEMAGERVAQTVRIQYGGSVKPANAKELFHQPDIDGGLIGGAALDADAFMAIVNAAL